jgi:hypothetical protein
MARRALAGVVAIGMLSGLLAGCSGDSSGLGGLPVERTGPAVTYVSVDEGTPADFRLAWEEQFYREALAPWAVAYDVSENDVMGAFGDGWQEAETELIQQVVSFRPSVVTVALGLSEVTSGVSAETFAGALARLLAALHDDAVPTVLVANLIPLPVSGGGLLVNAYNAAIGSVTRAEGDVLVDVHGAFMRAEVAGDAAAHAGGLTSVGQDLFAAAFDAAMKHRPDSR